MIDKELHEWKRFFDTEQAVITAFLNLIQDLVPVIGLDEAQRLLNIIKESQMHNTDVADFGTYTIEPDKINWEFVTDKDIIFKIAVFEDNLISVFTDDSRGKGYGIRGNYHFTDLLDLAESIKITLGLNPKFEVVRGKE